MPILEWLNKKQAVKTAKQAPYKLLNIKPELSYGKQNGNMIIKGDNLEALKALLPYYKDQVRCIYIDPPYNTGSAFEHYDDNLEHSTWLSMMYPRLELLRELLAEDGSIFVQTDDNEHAYLKVMMDEIFGRKNFITTIVWHKKRGKDNSSRYFSITHDSISVYAKNAKNFYVHKIELEERTKQAYTNPDNDERGVYRLLGLWSRKQGGSEFEYCMNNGKCFSKRLWLVNKDTMTRLELENRIVVKGDNLYRKLFLFENSGSIPETIWTGLSNNANAKDELKLLFGDNESELFTTPKPEPLIERVLKVSTNPGDIVLDSFLGSGTTAVVAQKTNRRYIGIEMGEHALTHVVPRLKKVIDGEQGGISKSLNWQGGGGFTFYDLGEIIFDKEGSINRKIDFKSLAFHIWFSQTKTALVNYKKSALLGVFNNTAYYLLYNGILGDKSISGGNVLTSKILESLPQCDADAPLSLKGKNGTSSIKKVIYGQACRLGLDRLRQENIIFKQTPYDIRVK
jgi:adenine-specific DNA-methyltransferase